MAGKEYEARDKVVRKMTRYGLVEENLRTGEISDVLTGKENEGRRMAGPGDLYLDRGRAGSSDFSSQEYNSTSLSDAGQVHRTNQNSLGSRDSRLDNDDLYQSNKTSEDELKIRESPDGKEIRRIQSESGRKVYREDPFYSETGSPMPDSYALGTGNYNTLDSRHLEDANGSLLKTRESLYDTVDVGIGVESDKMRRSGSVGYQNSRRHMLQEEQTGAAFQEQTTMMYPDREEAAYGHDQETRRKDEWEDAGSRNSEPEVRDRSRLQQRSRGHPSATAGNVAETFSTIQVEGRNRDASGDARHVKLYGNTSGFSGDNEGFSKGSRLKEKLSDLEDPEESLEALQAKRRKKRLYEEQRRQARVSGLLFDDETGMARSGDGFGSRAGGAVSDLADTGIRTVTGAAGAAIHAKVSENEDDNVGIQAVHDAEKLSETSVRTINAARSRFGRRSSQSSFHMEAESVRNRLFHTREDPLKSAAAKSAVEKKEAAKRFYRKQRQMRMYASARKEGKTLDAIFRSQQNLTEKAAAVLKEAIVRNTNVFLILGVVGLIFILVSASLGSCSALLQGVGHSMISTTYPSTDEDIYAVENRYRELEQGLNDQVNQMRRDNPNFDDLRYQIDEISHNPYHLISYFTSKYGQFTYEQVREEIEEIFREQYSISTDAEYGVTVTETKVVRPGESLGDVVTTGYCSCEICCGPWAGGTTATGTIPMSNYTIAVDADNPFVPLGTHIIMNGIEYVVEDTGAFGPFGVQFDVYYDDHQTALMHGRQIWEAYLAEGGGISELELTTTRTIDRMNVVLTNNDLDTVLQNRMNEAEKVRYALYNLTYGNRDYLFDLNNLPAYGRASRDYTIPPEALSDERFARMIAEAERHLGTPYVWGGYAPGGFDCSGFVCWVINHCGNGWDIGRTTAEGIRQQCYHVSPEDARPGDIVFFEHTYDTPGASHVGIYVGNNMMIHCGEPVQYTSLNGYWTDHFYEFGRLP